MEDIDRLIEEKQKELEELIKKKDSILFPVELVSVYETRYYSITSHNMSSGTHVNCGPSVGFWSFRSRTSFDSIILSESRGQFERFKSIIHKVIEDFNADIVAKSLSYNPPSGLPDKYLNFLSEVGFVENIDGDLHLNK